MGDISDGYLNLYQHLFTISAGLKFIRLVLVSPELERDDTDEVEVPLSLLAHADGKRFWVDYVPQDFDELALL